MGENADDHHRDDDGGDDQHGGDGDAGDGDELQNLIWDFLVDAFLVTFSLVKNRHQSKICERAGISFWLSKMEMEALPDSVKMARGPRCPRSRFSN